MSSAGVATSRKRVDAPAEGDLDTPAELAEHRDRFVEAMRGWYVEGKSLGKSTMPFLLRHTASRVLDHTWEIRRDWQGLAGTRDEPVGLCRPAQRSSVRGALCVIALVMRR